jgi:hypothetical protein
MNDEEFSRYYDIIRNNVNQATHCFYTSIEIHNFAAAGGDSYRAVNRGAAFWNVTLHGLQVGFFLALSRLFDQGKSVFTVEKFLGQIVKYPKLFSREAFEARRIAQNQGVRPDYLDAYTIWVPTENDLRTIARMLRPLTKKFHPVYRDIRDTVIAHTIALDRAHVEALFGLTLIANIEDIIYGLNDIIEVVWQLHQNGRRPEERTGNYDYKDRIKANTLQVLEQLQPR